MFLGAGPHWIRFSGSLLTNRLFDPQTEPNTAGHRTQYRGGPRRFDSCLVSHQLALPLVARSPTWKRNPVWLHAIKLASGGSLMGLARHVGGILWNQLCSLGGVHSEPTLLATRCNIWIQISRPCCEKGRDSKCPWARH